MVTCVDNIARTIALGSPGTTVSWLEPTATDNSGSVSLQSRSHAPGGFFSVGDTLVSYVFADSSGNRATCTFDVLITAGKCCFENPSVIVFRGFLKPTKLLTKSWETFFIGLSWKMC